MIILLDCDGVFCDFSAMVLHRLRKPGHVATQWDYSCTGANAYQIREAVAYSQDNCSRLNLYPGALEEINKLRDKGRVVCVTATVRTERLRWLVECAGFEERDVILTRDKSLIEGDLFVDDHPSHVREWQEKHPYGRAVLFSRPYNAEATDLERIECLSELFSC